MKTRKICKLGKIILTRLIEMEKTQDWLATNAKILPVSVTNYITGNQKPSVKTISKLSRVLEIDAEKIIEAIAEE